MSGCHQLTDRMPDVAHGNQDWTPAETAHLASCAACRSEWRFVQAAADRAPVPLDTEAVARRVLMRLRAVETPPRRRPRSGTLRWVSGFAAAAALALVVGTGTVVVPGPSLASPDTAQPLLPELADLTATELEGMLEALPMTTASLVLPSGTGLSDLSIDELERIARSLEG